MNQQEKYLFDLQGYITVPNALNGEQLRELNAIFDARIAQEVKPEATKHRFGELLAWGKPYLGLIENPRIKPYMDEIIAGNCRLDHDYADLIRSGKSPIGCTLHGGAVPFDANMFFNFTGGRMNNGLTVVAYNLKDVNPGDGGFGCVPGSHKSNYAFPSEWLNLEERHPCVKAVTGPAGTAIIFTEALTHGTLPWTGKNERRTLFYKYSPVCSSWSARYYDAEKYPGLDARQRELLEAPNARYSGR